MDAVECPAANHPLSNEPEPALDLIKPGTGGRREMQVESAALAGLEPTFDSQAFMRAVVVQNEVNVQIRPHLLLRSAEKLDEFPAAVTRQAAADDPSVQDIKKRQTAWLFRVACSRASGVSAALVAEAEGQPFGLTLGFDSFHPRKGPRLARAG
jgi:hypothetical protein